jgi:hypothetical protein
MQSKKLVSLGIANALGAFIYVLLVSWLMQNAERMFDSDQHIFQGAAMILLFVLSATIMATLVLGRPILLFLSNQKKDALKMFGITVATLIILTAIVFVYLLLR